jgi:hypothetical protein
MDGKEMDASTLPIRDMGYGELVVASSVSSMEPVAVGCRG